MALMVTVIVSLVLLSLVAKEGFAGYHARFIVFGTEKKEQANALAEGCADQALASVIADPSYSGATLNTLPSGTCYVSPIDTLNKTGKATIQVQSQVGSAINGLTYSNLAIASDIGNIHIGSAASVADMGTLLVQTLVQNNKNTNLTSGSFTMSVKSNGSQLSTFTGSATGVVIHMAPGNYSVSESMPAGFILQGQPGCSGTILAGEVKTCSMLAGAVTTTLTLVDTVVNNNHGQKAPTDFALMVDGTTTPFGEAMDLSSGTHTLSVASSSMGGYLSSLDWACMPQTIGGNNGASGMIDIATGDNKVCVVKLDDIPPPNPSCADTVMMLDRTGSMSSSERSWLKTAANTLTSLYSLVTVNSPSLPAPKLGVGSFGGITSMSSTTALVPYGNTNGDGTSVKGFLTVLYSDILSTITTITGSGSCNSSGSSDNCTDLSAAITKGTDELNSSNHTSGNQKVLILISDAIPSLPTGSSPANVGTTSPQTNSPDGTTSWNSPTNAYRGADSLADATTTIGSGSTKHRFLNFNIPALPLDAIINGIEVDADASTMIPTSSGSLSVSPTGTGNFNTWSVSGTTNKATAMSDSSTSTYISTTTDAQTFVIANAGIPSSATVNSVTLNVTAQENSGDGVIQLFAEKGTGVGQQLYDVPRNLTTTWTTYSWQVPTTPSGTAWTASEVNAWTTRFGMFKTGPGATVRVSEASVDVVYTPSGSASTSPLYPSASGDFTQWIPTGSSKDYTVLADSNDSTYIDTATAPLIDTVNVANASAVPSGATVNSVTLYVRAQGTTAGSTMNLVVAKDATHSITGPTVSLSTGTYNLYSYTFPTTGDNKSWTQNEVTNWTNSFGIRTTGTSSPKVSQEYVVVNYSTTSAVAGSSATSSPSSMGTGSWSSASSAYVSDNVYATDATSGHQQVYGNFGFSIPSGATVTGIQLATEAKVSGSSVASSTTTLYPTANGNYTQWTTGNYSNINETGTPSCSSSDYVLSGTTNDRSSFTLSLSAIPDGSTITSVSIVPSDRGDTKTGGTYKVFARLNGTNTDGTNSLTANSTSNCNSQSAQSITLSSTVKSGSTSLEIGVLKTSTNTNSVRIGALNAIVNYTVPVSGALGAELSWNNNSSRSSSESISVGTTESVLMPATNSASDTWGSHTWVPSDFNNGNFIVRLTNNSTSGATISLDQLTAKAFYTTISTTTASTSPLYPSASGDFTQWIPTGSSKDYTVLADSNDSTYIDTATAPLIDTVNVANASAVPSGATVNSVTLYVRAQGTTAGSTMNLVVAKDATHSITGPTVSLSTGTYNLYSYTFPTTGDNKSWTQNEVTNWTNSFGIRTTGTSSPKVSQEYVVVAYTPGQTTTTLNPSSAGNFNTWSSSGTSNKITAVTDGSSSTYVYENPIGQTFTFGNPSVPSGSTVTSVVLSASAMEVGGDATLGFLAENGTGSGQQGTSTPQNLTSSLATYNWVMTVNPINGHAWTVGDNSVNDVTNFSGSSGVRFGMFKTNATGTVQVAQLSLTVNYAASGSSACQLGVDLSWNAGSSTPSWTSQKKNTLNGTLATYKFGTPTDTWSRTWYPGDFSNTNFGVRVQAVDPGSSCQSTDIEHLDWLRLNVFYTTTLARQATLTAADTAKNGGVNIFTIYYNSSPVTTDENFMAELANGSTTYPGHQNGSDNDPYALASIGKTITTATTKTLGTDVWASSTNAFSSDNKYATNSVAEATSASGQAFTGFPFGLPPAASVTGVEVDVEANSTDSSGCSIGAEVSWDGGVTYTATGNSALITSTRDTTYKLYGASGSTPTLWG
ncbi:MAG: hypothetical protein RLZZ347_417, partial [Candidatus Parcubacteria bacterium]